MSSFHRALALQQSGRTVEAEAAYRYHVVSKGTTSLLAAAYNNLGSLLHSRGASDEAEASWIAATMLSPASPDAHSNLATALLYKGDTGRAWDTLIRAVSLVPTSSALYARLGAVLTAGRSMSLLTPEARRAATVIAREQHSNLHVACHRPWNCAGGG